MMITWPNESRPHAWVGVACFLVGKLELDVAAAGGLGAVLIRLCSSVIHGHLANATTPSGRRGDAAATDALTLTSGGRARTRAGVGPAPCSGGRRQPMTRGSTAPATTGRGRFGREECLHEG